LLFRIGASLALQLARGLLYTLVDFISLSVQIYTHAGFYLPVLLEFCVDLLRLFLGFFLNLFSFFRFFIEHLLSVLLDLFQTHLLVLLIHKVLLKSGNWVKLHS
jgi:hypothetical protein